VAELWRLVRRVQDGGVNPVKESGRVKWGMRWAGCERNRWSVYVTVRISKLSK